MGRWTRILGCRDQPRLCAFRRNGSFFKKASVMGFSFRNPIESPHVNEISAIRDFGACGTQRERISFVHRLCNSAPRRAAPAQSSKRGPGQC